MDHISITLSRVLQWLSRTGSPLVRWVLSGRAHSLMSGQLLLVSFTGRRSGRHYTRPVSYVRHGNELLIPGGGKWWRNLGSGPVSVRLRGTWLRVTPEVVTDSRGMAEMLGRMMASSRAVQVFTGIGRGRDGRPRPEDLERERRRGFVVVRFRLQDKASRVRVA